MQINNDLAGAALIIGTMGVTLVLVILSLYL